MLKEFKEFAMKGNVFGFGSCDCCNRSTFGKIIYIHSYDIIMPVISILTKGLDFENLFLSDGSNYTTLAVLKKQVLQL